mmetsp:Transcript_13556/g.53746  ORF Transcript_13556/g.53746 Transcript_13556/m.53746 type:complete len:233 (-) Transcript_13556:55-753(-)
MYALLLYRMCMRIPPHLHGRAHGRQALAAPLYGLWLQCCGAVGPRQSSKRCCQGLPQHCAIAAPPRRRDGRLRANGRPPAVPAQPPPLLPILRLWGAAGAPMRAHGVPPPRRCRAAVPLVCHAYLPLLRPIPQGEQLRGRRAATVGRHCTRSRGRQKLPPLRHRRGALPRARLPPHLACHRLPRLPWPLLLRLLGADMALPYPGLRSVVQPQMRLCALPRVQGGRAVPRVRA